MRQQEYIGIVRGLAKQIFEGINGLKTLQAEWNALDYLNTLPDGIEQNTGITAAEVGAVVFATADALEATLAAGHATNLARLL